jgi:hypothetical protein
MLLINRHGKDFTQLPLQEYSQTSEIAYFLKDYLPNKVALLVGPEVEPYDIDRLSQQYKVDYAFQDQSSHNIELPSNCYNFKSPFYYLTSTMDYFYSPKPGILFYPYWLLTTRQFPDNNIKIGSPQDLTRQFVASSIARHPKPHRIYNIVKLQKKSYLDKIYWTFFKNSYFDIQHDGLTDNEWNEFVEFYDKRPNIMIGEEQCVRSTDHEAFADSYVNITSETYTNYNFLSEKAYKPFLAGQLAMIYGTSGVVKMLDSLGFDMFYDIIDHDQYDYQPTYQKRIDSMLTLLDTVVTYNFEEIFNATAHRRQRNKDYLFSQELTDLVMTPFFTQLKEQAA